MANDRPQEQFIKKNLSGEIRPLTTGNNQGQDQQAQDKCRHSVTINKNPLEVFTFWRDFKHLPLFMKDLAEVRILSPKKSHWVVKTEHSPNLEWDAEIVAERAGESISWRSVENSEVKQSGTVWFLRAPAGRGTIVKLAMDFEIPGGKLAELAAKFIGEDPDTVILTNLRRFKACMETGEIATIEGQSSGREHFVAKFSH